MIIIRASTIDTILGSYEQLSDVERRIGDFIVKNVAEIPHLSVREIAEGSGTSSASVSRFVRRVGYQSFSDLRLAVTEQLAVTVRKEGANAAQAVSMDDLEGSVNLVLATKITELEATVRGLDPSRLRQAVSLIRSADSVVFGAAGNSINVCANLSFKLGQIGIRTVCPPNTDSMVLASLALGPRDVLVLVSASGRSRRLQTAIDNAEDAGCATLIITSSPASPLARRCDVVLDAVSRDHLLGMEHFSSTLSAVFVADLLFALVLSQDVDPAERATLEFKSLGHDKSATPPLL